MANLKEAKEIGSLIDTWGKIVVVVGGAVVSCAFAYYMLLAHEQRLDTLEDKYEKDIQILREEYKRQYGVVEEKSNQKFEQGMKVATELKNMVDKLDIRLNAEEQRSAYSSGWRDAKK